MSQELLRVLLLGEAKWKRDVVGNAHRFDSRCSVYKETSYSNRKRRYETGIMKHPKSRTPSLKAKTPASSPPPPDSVYRRENQTIAASRSIGPSSLEGRPISSQLSSLTSSNSASLSLSLSPFASTTTRNP